MLRRRETRLSGMSLSLLGRTYARLSLNARPSIRVAGLRRRAGLHPPKADRGLGPPACRLSSWLPPPSGNSLGRVCLRGFGLASCAHPATKCMPFGMPWSRAAPQKQKRVGRFRWGVRVACRLCQGLRAGKLGVVARSPPDVTRRVVHAWQGSRHQTWDGRASHQD